MRIDMLQINKTGVLAGALNGRAGLPYLLDFVRTEPAAPEPVFLDFLSIEVATASYLRECIVAFRDVIRGRDSLYYPIVANPNPEVRDELLELARARGDVFMTCVLAPDGTVNQPTLAGDLEAKQLLTFTLVQRRGSTNARELMREHGNEENVRHATAWNNRLAGLAKLGLIVEMRRGRLKRYRPLFPGVS